MKALAATTIVVALVAAACGDKRHRDLDWKTAPEAIDRARWATVCGSQHFVLGDESTEPMGRAIESWSGPEFRSCAIYWDWGGQPVVRDAYGVSVRARLKSDARQLVDLILRPMVPYELWSYLDAIMEREFSVFSIEAPGFNFAGGYNAATKEWDVRVKREKSPIGQRAIGW